MAAAVHMLASLEEFPGLEEVVEQVVVGTATARREAVGLVVAVTAVEETVVAEMAPAGMEATQAEVVGAVERMKAWMVASAAGAVRAVGMKAEEAPVAAGLEEEEAEVEEMVAGGLVEEAWEVPADVGAEQWGQTQAHQEAPWAVVETVAEG